MKVEEFNLINNDIYFMEIIGKWVIINNDYTGIMILDNHLQLIKKLFLIQELMIYSSFSSSSELLLFCPDNNCLIYINIKFFDFQIISLEGLENLILSAIYKWDQEEVILSSYKKEFIKLDLNNYSIKKLNLDNSECRKFREDYIKLSRFHVYKIYELEKKAFIKNSFSEVDFIKYKGKIEVLQKISQEDFHDFEAIDNYILKIGEEKAVLIHQENKKAYYPEKNYSYLRGKFLKIGKEIYFYLLSSHNAKLSIKIEKYRIP